MGLASDLGYTARAPNAPQRVIRAFGSTRAGAWFFSKTVRHIDRALHKLTHGRTSLPMLLGGLPVVMVTTTGNKSGQPRTTPLLAPPVGDTLALVGTNFGARHTPGWALNLEADPRARIEYSGRRLEVTARAATSDETPQVWAAAAAMFIGYARYQERISGRTVRLFVLEPGQAD